MKGKVEEALIELNFEILNDLNNHQSNALSITPKQNNIIKVRPEKKELGFVGAPTEIKKDLLLEAIKDKKIPLVVPMGIGEDNNIYNIKILTHQYEFLIDQNIMIISLSTSCNHLPIFLNG